MTTKAYIVISSEGSYEEYCTHYEKVFRRKDEADEYAKQLDAERFAEPVVEEKLWHEAERMWYYTNEQKFGEGWEVIPYNILIQPNEFEACQSKRDADKRNYLLAYINSHGKRTYSMEDVLHQEIYEDNRQFEWNPCEVMEIDFVEDLCVCKLKRKEQC
jgi:hypothetical protein